MKSRSVKKTDCKKGKDSSEPGNSIQDNAPKEDRCCEDGPVEGQAWAASTSEI
jgi:hypothetical protein